MTRCAHCGGKGADRKWDVALCALGEKLKGLLCLSCDTMLNDHVLSFFRVPRAKQLIRKYRGTQP